MLALVSAMLEIHSLFLGHWQRVGRVKGPSVMLSLKNSSGPCSLPIPAWGLGLAPPLQREQGASRMLAWAQAVSCIPGAVDWKRACRDG